MMLPAATRTSVIINSHYRLLTPPTIWATLLSHGHPQDHHHPGMPLPPILVNLYSHDMDVNSIGR